MLHYFYSQGLFSVQYSLYTEVETVNLKSSPYSLLHTKKYHFDVLDDIRNTFKYVGVVFLRVYDMIRKWHARKNLNIY